MSPISPYVKPRDLKIPPQSLDAEKALLGSLLMRGETAHDIADIVSEKSFYTSAHRQIFSVIFDLHTKGAPIDVLSVSARLKDKGELENIGGMSYLTELLNTVPSSSNAGHYAEI